jgi:hypothetical protein
MKIKTINDNQECFIALKDLPKGEFLKRDKSHSKVYTRGDYDRSSKRFYIHDCEDISRSMLIKGNKPVFINFEY